MLVHPLNTKLQLSNAQIRQDADKWSVGINELRAVDSLVLFGLKSFSQSENKRGLRLDC